MIIADVYKHVFKLVQNMTQAQRLKLVEIILPQSERCVDNDGQVVLYTGWQEEECK